MMVVVIDCLNYPTASRNKLDNVENFKTVSSLKKHVCNMFVKNSTVRWHQWVPSNARSVTTRAKEGKGKQTPKTES